MPPVLIPEFPTLYHDVGLVLLTFVDISGTHGLKLHVFPFLKISSYFFESFLSLFALFFLEPCESNFESSELVLTCPRFSLLFSILVFSCFLEDSLNAILD